MFTAITFLRAWNSASEVASWLDLKDVVLWFRHLPCVVMSLPCSVILDIRASHCWRIKSEFYKLPSEYLLFSFSHPSHTLKHLFLFLGGALYIFSPLFLHMLFISFCLKCFFFFFCLLFSFADPHLEIIYSCFMAQIKFYLLYKTFTGWAHLLPCRQK